MILKIDFDPSSVIYKNLKSGRILLKCRYYSAYSSACHLATTEGTIKKDFDTAPKAKGSKTVFIGNKGGISL